MYTYNQFVQKHATKFNKLSKAEKKKRYDDYLSTSPGTPIRKTANLSSMRRQANPGFNPRKGALSTLLSPCASHYLKALTNPWGKFSELPCIPDTISLPSYKFKCVTRGSFTVGSGLVGYVGVAPFVPVNDQPCVVYTGGTYAGTNFQYPAAGVFTAVNDSPFTTADIGNMEFRLVGCGVQASYFSSEVFRAGLVVLHRDPLNQAIPSGSNSASLLAYRTSTQAHATSDLMGICYQPSLQDQLSYVHPVFPQAVTLLFYVEGGNSDTSWSYEVVQFFEAIGNRQSPTASHADPVGMGAVLSSLPVKNSTAPPVVTQALVTQQAAVNVRKSFSGVIQDFIGGVGAGIKAASQIYNSDFGGGMKTIMQGAYGSNTPAYQSMGYPAITGGPIIEEID